MSDAKTLKRDIDALDKSRPSFSSLDKVQDRDAIPGKTGIGEAIGTQEEGTGLIDSLYEKDNVRKYFGAGTITSTDGLFVIEYKYIKTAYFRINSKTSTETLTVHYDDPDTQDSGT